MSCLQEALTQYCAAASITKYIRTASNPFALRNRQPQVLRALSCIARPDHTLWRPQQSLRTCQTILRERLMKGIRVPGRSPSLQPYVDRYRTDGIVHIGIDAFPGAMIDSIERITFVTSRAYIVRLSSSRSTESISRWSSAPVRLTTPNLYLRSHPSTILSIRTLSAGC